VVDVRGSRIDVGQQLDERRGELLVEQELHVPEITISFRGISAAKASEARISSGSRYGKSARTSSCVIPEARYSRMS